MSQTDAASGRVLEHDADAEEADRAATLEAAEYGEGLVDHNGGRRSSARRACFIEASAVGVVAAAVRDGVHFRLVAPQPIVRKVLAISGLRTLITVDD